MRIEDMASEAQLCAIERADHADNLERAIAQGHVKRPFSDVQIMRGRHPAMRAGARALRLLVEWRERLPAEFIASVEEDQ